MYDLTQPYRGYTSHQSDLVYKVTGKHHTGTGSVLFTSIIYQGLYLLQPQIESLHLYLLIRSHI
jgi:hypothetical protein